MIDFKQLRKIRKMLDVTLEEAGKKSGLSPASISLIERGICPNTGVESVEAIANVYGYELVLQPINPTRVAEREVNKYLPTQGTTLSVREIMLD